MSSMIENALHEACKQDADDEMGVALLWAQWEFDKRLLSRALQQVSQYFPHYSLHDASHSRSILTQIERLLGTERVGMLPATDLWLLLEAAYSHDIGMVIPDSEARKWLKDSKFQKHLLWMLSSGDHEFQRAAKLLRDDAANIDFEEKDWSLDVRRAVTLAIAEYGRPLHPERARKIISSPAEQIGLKSPRTDLIPARLFHVLGEICHHHGKSFQETMALPNCENGLGHDQAHPRFVACMLRLGDLLDLDNGRFCPVMMRSFGPLPSTSMAHVRKHAAIRHLNVSRERVEVDAVCEDFDSYEETDRWFNWLRTELRDQSSHWADIVPVDGFGALATAGKITAVVEGHISLPQGQRPRFEVDRAAIVQLVQGANLYPHDLSCIRELIQNAVDATLRRAWLERLEHGEDFGKLGPRELREWLKRWPIDINLQKLPAKNPGKVRWKVSIQDRGTGIGLADIPLIQRIGGSRGTEGRASIAEMPEWMRPSGTFGIGLQSVFLITDELNMFSRHHETGAGLCLTLKNPRGKEGLLIREMTEEERENAPRGTRVEFVHEFDAIPPRVNISYDPDEVRRVLADYDPIRDAELPYLIARTRDEIRETVGGGFCLTQLDGVDLPAKFSSFVCGADDEGGQTLFSPEHGLEIQILAKKRRRYGLNNVFFFRGMEVASKIPINLPIFIECNIHFGDARNLLTLNREKFTPRGNEKVGERFYAALNEALRFYLLNLRKENNEAEHIQLVSLSAYIRGLDAEVVGEEWKRVKWPWCDLSLGEIADATTLTISEYREEGKPRTEIKEESGAIALKHYAWEIGGSWREDLLSKLFPGRAVSHNSDAIHVFRFSEKKFSSPVTDHALRHALRLREVRLGVGNRISLPTPEGFEVLNITPADGYWERLFPEFGPRMMCPFTFIDGVVRVPELRRYVSWTAERSAGRVTEAQVAKVTIDFIEMAHRLMSEQWEGKRAYSLNECKRELRKEFDDAK